MVVAADSGAASAGPGLTFFSAFGFFWGHQCFPLSGLTHASCCCVRVHLHAKMCLLFLEKTADKACWAFPVLQVLNQSVCVPNTDHWLRGICQVWLLCLP